MTTTLALKLLGSTLLVSVFGIIALVALDKTVPDILELLAASSLSAIAGVSVPRGSAPAGAPDGDLDGPAHRAP
jgi:hypothetical protein